MPDIIYLRKSRADGEHETVEQVLAKHETQLQEFALSELGHRIDESDIYREVVSGETISDRPIIQKVLRRLETDDVTSVIVIEPQRLSRGDLVDCGVIVNAFRYTGTLVRTPSMTYNLTVKMERKFFEQELMRGNDYLEYTKEILNRGRIASVKKGNFIGSIAPYGYRKVQCKDENNNKFFTLEIVPEEAAAIKAMYDAFVNQGFGFTNTAKYLDSLGFKPRSSQHWSPAAVKDMLENPVYVGKIRWNWRKTEKVMSDGTLIKSRPKSDSSEWILVDGKHEPIVSEELYNQALARRGTNIRIKSKVAVRNPFAGLLYCHCGRAMTYRTYKQPNGSIRSAPRLVCDDQTHCKTKSCSYEDMRQYVITLLNHSIEDFTVKMEHSQEIDYNKELITALRAELKKIDELDDEQHDLLESKIYTRDVFLKRNAKLLERRQNVLASIIRLENEQPAPIDYAERIMTFTDALTALEDTTSPPDYQNNLLKKCIRRMTYMRDTTNRTKWDTTLFELDVELLM